MSYPTLTGDAVEGALMHKIQASLGPAFAQASYQFNLSGTNTPANVYQDGNLTTPYPTTGFVAADQSGRFPPIYLDPSIIYQVNFFDSTNTLRYTIDPYTPSLSTRGSSQNSSFGLFIAATGEVTVPAPNSGGSGVSMTVNAGAIGVVPLKISSTLPGTPALIINSSATTGVQTATFTATNKPGTATSSPAGWLPITCDGVQYYTPIWHGNNFTPYTAQPTALGSVIAGQKAAFNGNGTITMTSGTAAPSSWFAPSATGIGASYYINFTKTGGLAGCNIGALYTATVTPSGTYTGGSLTTNFQGATGSDYTLQLATGQLITGCTFTNGSAVFTTPSTTINAGATTALFVGVGNNGRYQNISSNGITFEGNNVGNGATYNYNISTSITGTPVVASGTIVLQGVFGPNQASYNNNVVSGNWILNGDGTSTTNGGATVTGWAGQGGASLANQGANYWIKITQTGGTAGYTFSAATSWTNISNSSLSIGISGPVSSSTFSVTGTYQIALDSLGTNIVGSGSVTLTGGTDVQSVNWSGTSASPSIVLSGAGATTVDGGGVTGWYVPNSAGIGASYYIDITRTSGTSGVNFSAAQGAWTNIGAGGLTIALTGYTGDAGTVGCSGTYQISNAPGGTVLGSGTISLNISGLTIIHIYTSGSNATETIPTGAGTAQVEAWGGGGGGSGGQGSGCAAQGGSTGGAAGYAYKSYAVSALGGSGKTFKYTVGGGGAGGASGADGTIGTASSIVAGTVTGFTTITCNPGNPGIGASGGGAGGTASGGTTNVTGQAGGNGAGNSTSGKISGDGNFVSPGGVQGAGTGSGYGAGGSGGGLHGAGHAGYGGVVVFFYS